ncbi:peptidylprolyl isomerase [Nitrospinae bacterium AH_259_B05_G02_I21]|nr:peptidylprolyl isomerase [Nitrospinae bacterium AH_259_B05_G02_I21]
MSSVEEGRTMVFHYTGTLADGTVFDSSREGRPMEVQIGAGQIPSGFESGLMGMRVGESRTFTIGPEDAYGAYDEDLCRRVKKERFAGPEGIKVGMEYEIAVTPNRSMVGTVIQVGEEDVLIDLNHPLAGKALTFEVECIEIRNS